jgi:ribosomal protein S18 acetylase RimI-like enzyme
MQYRLVPATPEDKAWLQALWRAAYLDLFVATWGGWDESRYIQHFSECWSQGNIYAVELDSERIGMIQLIEHSDSLEVSEIQIQPSHQGRGIGTQILRDTQKRAHAQHRKVILSTGLRNHGAVRLYERLGFRAVHQSETHIHMESNPQA